MQISWFRRLGMWRSGGKFFGRFVVAATTEGFTAFDKETGELVRVTSRQAAFAWCGIRAGETVVHRADRSAHE